MFASYSLCAARLADIEAIDYFFARELTGLVESSNETDFCLLLALSRAQRMGNSCLIVSELAGEHCFAHSDEPDSGFIFAHQDELLFRAEALVKHPGMAGRLHWYNGRLYTARYWQFEQQLVANFDESFRDRP